MDFYSVLESCYKRDTEPFLLYCIMSDFCKGDLQLKEDALRLYNIYKQRDIFYEISFCREDRFSTILNRYGKQNKNCLLCVAKLLRPDWELTCDDNEQTPIKVQVKKVNAVIQKQASSQPQAKQNALPANVKENPPPTPTPVKKPRKHRKVETIFISGLVSDYLVETCDSVSNVEVSALKTGTWTVYKTYSLRNTSPLIIILDGLVADKIKISIPQEKFAYLSISKVHGNVKLIDYANCFKRLSVNVDVGNVSGYVSPMYLDVVCKAGDIDVTYVANQNWGMNIRNTLGDVRLALHNVSGLDKNVVSGRGKVTNTHTPSMIGYRGRIKIETMYGNVNIT